MRTVWLVIAAILVAGLAPMWAADAAKKDIPLYDGKPGAKKFDMRINPKDGAEMVWVPAGTFLMGSTDEQTAAALKEWPEDLQSQVAVNLLKMGKFSLDAEKPQRKVYLDGYWMYKYEVTVAQYRKFCKATKREMPPAPDWGWKDDHPMVRVTWQDAADYAKWAGVSLPTEAQWEKAARGTDGRTYPWGNKWDASKCANSVETELKSAQPAGSHASDASPYGCMDMAGNVLECCADWYDPNYYKNAPTRNPKGPSEAVKFTVPTFGDSIIASVRVLRGGSWYPGHDHYGNFQCAGRYFSGPSRRRSDSGFRCARTADRKTESAGDTKSTIPATVLPRYANELSGSNEVRIKNPNDFSVRAGLRSGVNGKDMDVPANGVESVYVPDGRYDIYFVYSNKPDALFQGDSFTLSGNGVEIQIVKVVGGNYSIRQVK